MKREKLLRYLRANGCEQIREGGNHSWWHNPEKGGRSAIPRHREINELLVKKILKDLNVKPI